MFFSFSLNFPGVYHSWKSNATGRGAKTVLEYFEKNYDPSKVDTTDLTISFAVRGLLEVVQGKNLEVVVMEKGQPVRILTPEEVDRVATTAEKEREEEQKDAKNKQK